MADINEIKNENLEEIAGGAGHKTIYTVVHGDTLTRIAHRFGVTVADLVYWNNIADPNLIRVGQKLVIYV